MNQKEETFEIWKKNTFTRIDNWKKTVDVSDMKIKLDYSIKSLSELEKYILSKYSEVDLKNQKNNLVLDAIASYIGESFIGIIPESKWGIYAKDKTNVYYGLPCVFTKYSGSISVHFQLRNILRARTNKVLETHLNKVLKKDEKFRQLVNKNNANNT
ncbi:hypothetical protein KLA_17584 [Cellulophaga geojensis KL-A]|uniref:DUF3806 domain-containing protein n=1 Tax=Cellulophaga geojensis KL-A TaxID=1328323 RepID=A0ABP3B241_9FLAO|nr:hypothetical protein [Cellulophaga geojensis]EWH08344.1 hypothetical protein KLA_17584 [Cellulophaga geojensis KL-A]